MQRMGGVLSLTNLYIGAKTGWTLGVGITSVILAFALFKVICHLTNFLDNIFVSKFAAVDAGN